VLGSPEGLSIGGIRREVTLLMSDLRGFTLIAETLPPEDLVRMLNRYLGAMSEVIEQFRGTIDEFTGDGILVLFGAPVQADDDAERAVACALRMQEAMGAFNDWAAGQGYPSLAMGIGVNTGEVVVGNMGSETRTKYGVIGSAINVTARIESCTVGGQVLMGERTFELLEEMVETLEPLSVSVKGRPEPLFIREVVACCCNGCSPLQLSISG
jgi:adenylate cyclase